MARCQEGINAAQKQANDVAEDMRLTLDDFLEDLPTDSLDDATLNNLYKRMRQTAEVAANEIARFRKAHGIQPVRKKVSTQALADYTTSKTVQPVLQQTKALAAALGKYVNGTKGIQGIDVEKSYTAALKGAFKQAIPEKYLADFEAAGGNWEGFVTTLKRMSHEEQAELYSNLNDAVPTHIQRLREELAAIDTTALKGERNFEYLQRVHNELNDIEAQLSGAVDSSWTQSRNPFEDATEMSQLFLDATTDEMGDIDFEMLARQFNDSKAQSLIKHQFGGLTESVASRLIKSKVPGAIIFTLNLLETPSGFGGEMVRNSTAAIRGQMLHQRSLYKVATAYSELLDGAAKDLDWGRKKRFILQDGHPNYNPELAQLNKQVMLHNNALKLGRPSNAPDYVVKYNEVLVREYHDIHERGIGKVEGISGKNKIEHYHHQQWDDQQINMAIKSPRGKQEMIELFRRSMVSAGMPDHVADIAADAVINQKINAFNKVTKPNAELGDIQRSGIMPQLAEIVEHMETTHTKPQHVRDVIDSMTRDIEGDELPGYAHHRINLDLSTTSVVDGKKVSITDMMDMDTAGNFDRYAKEATGRIAIAEAMPLLNSDRAINEYIQNTGKQAQMMGTAVDTKMMRNTLNILLGLQHVGQLPIDARRIRDAVALAGMGGLGESQLAELGLAMNRGVASLVGAAQVKSRGKGRAKKALGIELSEADLNNPKTVGELQEMAGLFSDSHRVERRNIHFDQVDNQMKQGSKIVDVLTGGKYRNNLKAAQERFTGYGVIRGMENQLAMAGLLQDVARSIRGEKAFTSRQRYRDLGIDIDKKDNVFYRNILQYATMNDGGYIEALNIHRWTQADRDSVGIILGRHAGQAVQLNFAGEMSHAMENPWVKFMLQFRQYPILAAEKQQARHLKFADKEAATGLFLNAASSSGARILRYAALASAQPLGERQDYIEKRMASLPYDTFAYMGIAGMTPNIAGVANQFLGNPLTINGMGTTETIGEAIPVLTYANKILESHEAITGPDSMDDNDFGRIQSLLPLGTIGFVNIMAGIFRTFLDE